MSGWSWLISGLTDRHIVYGTLAAIALGVLAAVLYAALERRRDQRERDRRGEEQR